jgi:hypothetical protein
MKGLDETQRQPDTLSAISAALRADRTIPSGDAGALEQLVRVVYARLSIPGTKPQKATSARSKLKKQ